MNYRNNVSSPLSPKCLYKDNKNNIRTIIIVVITILTIIIMILIILYLLVILPVGQPFGKKSITQEPIYQFYFVNQFTGSYIPQSPTSYSRTYLSREVIKTPQRHLILEKPLNILTIPVAK